MRIYLINPKQKWHKANLHCHTTNSDGNLTPLEMKKLYQEHGYSIVAFTDHELLFDSSYLTDENFVAITASEYSISDLKNPAYRTYVARDENGNVHWRDIKTIHLNLFSKDPHSTFHIATSYENLTDYHTKKYSPNKIEVDGYHRVFTKESIQEVIDRANKAGFLVQFNHPNWSLNTREDYIDLKGLWSLEILNYGTELETGAEYCINIYDDMLRSGQKLFCSMGDDNHNRDKTAVDSFGGFNYVGVDNLTYDEVMHSLEVGNFYCSNGPKIKSLYIDTKDGKIYVKCSKAVNIIFVSYNRGFRNYSGENLTTADFKIFGKEEYFRITVKDKYGKVAHTHAYYLKDYGY
ncbi:MAG: hypothetical protein MJ227_02990 [Bacilli bacterium]|nr:hypothetical protein [Bacilli bacterium]